VKDSIYWRIILCGRKDSLMSAGKGNPGYPIISFGKLALKINLKI